MEMFPGKPNISQTNSVIWKNKALKEYLLLWSSQRVEAVQH